MASTEKKSLSYKGRPIVKMGGIIYYGNPEEKYVIMMQILNSEDFKEYLKSLGVVFMQE